MDGVDASVIKSDGKNNYEPIFNKYFEYDELIYSDLLNLRNKINSIKDLTTNSYQIKELERKITLFHAKISKETIKSAGIDVDLIGFHGQTIFHNAQEKISKQIGDGNLLSSLLKKEVVYNFRENDILNGGQGAPLAPIFHNLLINQNQIERPACVLNIGGIANITLVVSKNNEDLKSFAVDDARALAQRADEALKRGGEKPSKLADAGSTLMLVYRAVSQMSTAEKKAPQLHVVNNLFKVYFKLNALHLCKNLINAVNLPTFLPFDSFPKSEKVTYNFYVGRLAVFEDAYERAAEHLEYAFAHCHAQSARNVRLILQYLIPVKLILGTLPSRKLLEKYELREFVDVVEAMRRGDARTLDAALSDGESTFIKQGTYLILEKLRMSVYRTLFKKVHAIHGETADAAKANQVSLAKFQTALAWCGADDVDLDEVECIVANLIFRKFIKGYISHKNRVLVLSKADPFPSLQSVFAD